jgi:hypothetical protein
MFVRSCHSTRLVCVLEHPDPFVLEDNPVVLRIGHDRSRLIPATIAEHRRAGPAAVDQAIHSSTARNSSVPSSRRPISRPICAPEWETAFTDSRAANLYAQALTWSDADISGGGDLPAALAAIQARVLLLPSETDLYFRVADNAAELPHLASAELLPIPSIWGHRAGNPVRLPAELAFVRTAVKRWLES